MTSSSRSDVITTRHVLSIVGTILVALTLGLGTMVLQMRLELQELRSWKDLWKPQVDGFMVSTQLLDKNVALLTQSMLELTGSSKELLGAIRTQQAELEKLSSMQIALRVAIDRLEVSGKRH